jgi:hypothetical protein
LHRPHTASAPPLHRSYTARAPFAHRRCLTSNLTPSLWTKTWNGYSTSYLRNRPDPGWILTANSYCAFGAMVAASTRSGGFWRIGALYLFRIMRCSSSCTADLDRVKRWMPGRRNRSRLITARLSPRNKTGQRDAGRKKKSKRCERGRARPHISRPQNQSGHQCFTTTRQGL